MMLATHSLRDGAPQFSTSHIWSVETVFFSDKQAFLVSKLLKWEANCCLWYISIVDSRYKPLLMHEKNVRPRNPRYILERTILETENTQSRVLGGSCKQCVQALDLMNCTTHIVQDFTKLLLTNIWVRVVVITTLNYVLDASAFLMISAILGLTICLPLELWVPSRSVSCVNWKFHSRSVRRAHFAHSWTVSSNLRLQIRFTFKNLGDSFSNYRSKTRLYICNSCQKYVGAILYHNNWGTLVFVWWLVLFRWSWKTGRTVVDKSYYMHCTGTAKLQDKNVCHTMVVVKIANFVLNHLWLIILSDMSRI